MRPGGSRDDHPCPSQPDAEGAFRRGSGLNLTSGQYRAPVAGFYALAATLHVGEARGVGGPPALSPTQPPAWVTTSRPPPQRSGSHRGGGRRAPETTCACSSASSPGASATRECVPARTPRPQSLGPHKL